MSDARPVARRAAGGAGRVRAAWRGLAVEQRRAGVAALGLLLAMFLPWYSATRPIAPHGRAQSVTDSHSAISVFSWVEAAVLLVALGVLALLFARGERRAFHLPGGDGVVVTAAGAWACLLMFWRFFDKPDLGAGVTVGLQWGIFVALAVAAVLALAGNRMRAAHAPEPPLERQPRPRPPDEAVPVRIPDDRPHLDDTRVLSGRGPQTPAGRRGPAPLSREAAARDTADFRAVPPPENELTEPLLPEGHPANERTEPLAPRDEERTEPLPPREDDQPTLPGMPD